MSAPTPNIEAVAYIARGKAFAFIPASQIEKRFNHVALHRALIASVREGA